MAKKRVQLIGMRIDEFERLLDKEQKGNKEKRFVIGQKARLIPAFKKLDELSLASVFMATLPLVKEFRELVLKEIKVSRAGELKAYTEVSFPNFNVYVDGDDKKGALRVDGLLLRVASNIISDAVFFEMKKGSQKVNAEQINSYIELARQVGAKKIVSISNQFVPYPTDFPVEVTRNKNVDLYHFSWRYIIALTSILITDNDLNIADPNQVLIMKEVAHFLRNPEVGVKTFDRMSNGWINIAKYINQDAGYLKKNDDLVSQAVHDWIQEEQDLALKISDRVGHMVDCNVKQCKTMYERIKRETESLLKNKTLNSIFRFHTPVSPLNVTFDLGNRMLKAMVEVEVPEFPNVKRKETQTRNQIKFVAEQLEKLEKDNSFEKVKPYLHLIVQTKGHGPKPQHLYVNWDELIEESQDREINSVQISYQKNFHNEVTKNKVFISEYEKSIKEFYRIIIQHLTQPDPKKKGKIITAEEVEENEGQ